MEKKALTDDEKLAKKEAYNLYMKKYRELNKDKIKEINKRGSKKYYQSNLDSIGKKQKEYRDNNKDKIKEWRDNNKEYIKEINEKYYLDNKADIKIKQQEYYQNNKETIRHYKNEYKKKRMISDPLFKLKENIKTSVYIAFKRNGYTEKSKTTIILGCSYHEFKQHLESKFIAWMNWNNRGKYNGELDYGWDIDHIKPLSSAKTEDELLTLCHYTNLQPLCSKVNRDIKRNTLNY